MQKISPFLWFNDQAEEAATFYTSVFKNAKIGSVTRYDEASAKASGRPEGSAMTVTFTLEGLEFTALNGGPMFTFNESISFVVACKDQAEIDYYWGKLSAVPEAEQCGWCKDKFGVSWQIIPENLSELMRSPQVTAVLMQAKKIDIEALKRAA